MQQREALENLKNAYGKLAHSSSETRKDPMKLSELKPAGIPLLVTVYRGVFALIGTFLGISALIDPSSAVGYIDGADMISRTWARRTLGLAFALALAIWFLNAQVYTIAFLGSVYREGGDIVGAINSASNSLIPVLGGFFALDVICLLFSLRALKQQS